ncbi:hypothetical protein FJZ53_06510 [Candidatus Woesearchaeota archaeon]|nr:hypothetical protein [Candidatus Woesearchaeota archaeon]
MRIPRTFLPKSESLEEKTKNLLNSSEKKVKGEFYDLESLKNAKTKEEKKNFLKLFSTQIPELFEQVKEKMIKTNTDEVYLEKGKISDGYSPRLEIGLDNHLEFHHQIYRADLENKGLYRYNGYVIVYEYIETYPDKDNDYYSIYSGDILNRSFKTGKEMYECVKEFLEK